MNRFTMKRLLFALATTASLLQVSAPLSCAEARDLYVLEGRGGSITFTSRKPSEGQRYRTLRPGVPFTRLRSRGGGLWRPIARKSQYDSLIRRMATEFGLSGALVKAVVQVESGFRAYATSHKGAMGLMQLMPHTARRMGVRDAYHPEQNLRGGSKYLKFLLERYSGNVKLALAAYNAGEGAVDRMGGIPPYEETQNYVRRVMTMKSIYERRDHSL